MSFAKRLLDSAERAGFDSQAALARACDVTPGSISQLLSADGSKMAALLKKIAQKTGVSVAWLRSGDPTEAPPWADRRQVVLDAAKELSERDRAWIIEHAFAAEDIARSPASATAELVQLRLDRELATQGIRTLHRQALAQMSAIRRLAAELGVLLKPKISPTKDDNVQADADLAAIEDQLNNAAESTTPYDNQHQDTPRRSARP